MMKKIKNQQGFTLIELIIVIAVIAILAAVLLPRFLGFTEDAKFSAAKSDAKNLATAVEAIKAQNYTFSATDTTADNTICGPGEAMGYVGKQLPGSLAFTVASGDITSFLYTRNNGTSAYPVTYTLSTGLITLGTVSPTNVSETAILIQKP
ncbi:MAG: prepilin-type N-terminal cleavage/methylation domain-containing protein [Clostridia bacterium]